MSSAGSPRRRSSSAGRATTGAPPPSAVSPPPTPRRPPAGEFRVGETVYDGGAPAFSVLPTPDARERFLALREKVAPLGYLPLLRRRHGRTVLAFVPPPAPPPPR